MIKSLFSAITGLKSHQTLMDVIGNNIANVNSAGFKSSRVVFTDVYYQTMAFASAPTATTGGANPTQTGHGSQVASIDVLNTRSGFQQTFRPLDNYIAGDGFFVLDDGNGNQSYSRVGNLNFDVEGKLIDGNGRSVCGSLTVLASPIAKTDVKAIEIADIDKYTGIAIDTNGKITGVEKATGTITDLAYILLASFQNVDGLSQEGNMNRKETVNSGTPTFSAPGDDYTGLLISGGLELSNVDLSKEFTDMIIAQRGFQANSRVITTSDEILQELVNLKR